MNLPIEIVQQRRDGPLRLVLAELPGVRRDARFHRESVFAESLRFGELAEYVPGLFPIEHRVHDSAAVSFHTLYTLTSICFVAYIKRVESVFEVIAEPNRRAILSLLVSSQQSVGEIERQLGMPQPAVSKHLRVLREAGFVESTVDAQRRLYRLRPEPLQEVEAWLAPFRRFWSAHVDALERHLDRMDRLTQTKTKARRRRRGPNREREKGETK